MAATNQIEQRKLALVQQLEASRGSLLGAKLLLDEQVASKKASLKESLNLPQRVKQSFTQQPFKSGLIALGSGLAASLFLRGRSKKASKHPKAEKVAKQSLSATLILAVLKPILQRTAMQFYHQWLEKREQQRQQELGFPNRQERL